MADPGDVVDRADALMRRRRSFVAKPPVLPPEVSAAFGSQAGAQAESAAATLDVRLAADSVGGDDDLPVLTDVVAVEDDTTDAGNRRQERFDETQVALLAAQIAHAIGEQLASDLPELIETALASASDQLRSGIGATMETALRDFIARRRQLALPLDEPRDDDA